MFQSVLTKLTGKAPDSSDIDTLNKSLQAVVSSIERIQTEGPRHTHQNAGASSQFPTLATADFVPRMDLIKDEVCTQSHHESHEFLPTFFKSSDGT